ncbi:heavy-metal-associated domain-containing protein [Xylanimonas ulmi]|uniref:Copper chaperone CopZ n=1 Tax=Xylanimonas ulmi TaxID=228973 RepID=A0A4Q7M3J8_9MICO|nr:heavy-metal-associated domain-containing protein [Xylanibacterium ulmi]RZS62496.1 copper chaperone CopZ [Xylanibacterium ulmi]
MTTLTTLSVTGMTCQHCVAAVTRELKAVDGVGNLTVELRAGDASVVSVHSASPLDEAALREAIAEAGYDVAKVDVLEDALAAQMTERSDQYRATGTRSAEPERAGHAHAHAHGGGHGGGHGQGGCGGGSCGCGGKGRQGLGVGLPIVPLG